MCPLINIKQKQNMESVLENIIQSKGPDSISEISALCKKLKTLQNQTNDNKIFGADIFEYENMDYELLCKLILVACGASTILAAIAVMNEIGWFT